MTINLQELERVMKTVHKFIDKKLDNSVETGIMKRIQGVEDGSIDPEYLHGPLNVFMKVKYQDYRLIYLLSFDLVDVFQRKDGYDHLHSLRKKLFINS